MKLTRVLPAAAVVGLLLATFAAVRSNAKKPASVPVAQPAEAPFTLQGKQAIRKPFAGSSSSLCSFSIWQ